MVGNLPESICSHESFHFFSTCQISTVNFYCYWKICAVHRYAKRPKSLIVNVSRRVYYEKITNVDNKRLHFFKWFVNFILNIFAVRENSKFQLFGAAVSKIYSETVATK